VDVAVIPWESRPRDPPPPTAWYHAHRGNVVNPFTQGQLPHSRNGGTRVDYPFWNLFSAPESGARARALKSRKRSGLEGSFAISSIHQFIENRVVFRRAHSAFFKDFDL
jgi:hypothetical protein